MFNEITEYSRLSRFVVTL